MRFFKSFQNNKFFLISILATALLLIIGQLLQNDFVFDRNAIQTDQWWRVVSGNFTHSNIPHLLLNLSGLCLLMLLFIDSLNTQTFILSTLLLSIIVGLGLFYFTPELHRYYGFSGVLYGLYFLAAICAILDNDKFTGISIAVLIAGKILWDNMTGGNQSSAELIGVPVANDAHLYGFIGAVLLSVFLFLSWRFKHSKRHPPTFQ